MNSSTAQLIASKSKSHITPEYTLIGCHEERNLYTRTYSMVVEKFRGKQSHFSSFPVERGIRPGTVAFWRRDRVDVGYEGRTIGNIPGRGRRIEA